MLYGGWNLKEKVIFPIPISFSECKNMSLECTINATCKCPDYTVTCEGPCDKPVQVITYGNGAEGIPAHCKPNDTCTPSECTSELNMYI